MAKLVVATASAIGALFLSSAAPPASPGVSVALVPAQSQAALTPDAPARFELGLPRAPVSMKLPDAVEPPPPPTPREALRDGVLIVVSLASQQAFVFKQGKPWDSTPVSTGKPGNDTPAGVFPILQKKVHHRSSLYDDAPMPFMQRLTWDGVALHAGRIPGYPASHGCIRLPNEFARKLYGLTNHSTIVVVTDKPVESDKEARAIV